MFQVGSAKDIKKQIAEFRAQGMPVTPEMVVILAEAEEREAENVRFKAEREQAAASLKAAEEQARLAGAEAALKATARQAFWDSGGVDSDFEKAWPDLRAEIVKQGTLNRLAHHATAQTDLVRRKRETGDYTL
jgi:hypothetical protein